MKELLLYIARSLVDHPDQVTVTEVENGDELTLELLSLFEDESQAEDFEPEDG